jgi:vancomycin resistance protein VanJ
MIRPIRFLGRLIIASAWVFAWGLVIWNLARLYPGDRWLFVRLGNYFAPWLFMALAPALGVALLARRTWLARLVLLLALIFGVRYFPLLVPRLSVLRAEADATELRVMTFNVHYDNRDARGIADLIRTEAPDIIALQELSPELADSLRREMLREYPYFLYDGSSGLAGLLSRYPLTAEAVPRAVSHTLRAVLATPAGPVTVWNVHLAVALSQRGWERQKEMAAAIVGEIDQEATPLIILGDFNTTDQTENYALIAGRLTDVHWSAGHGFGFSFPNWQRYRASTSLLGPLVRIDHILVSRHWVPQDVHVASRAPGSDHWPVLVTLRFRD